MLHVLTTFVINLDTTYRGIMYSTGHVRYLRHVMDHTAAALP